MGIMDNMNNQEITDKTTKLKWHDLNRDFPLREDEHHVEIVLSSGETFTGIYLMGMWSI